MKYLVLILLIVSCNEYSSDSDQNKEIKLIPNKELNEADSFVISVENWEVNDKQFWSFANHWTGIDSVRNNIIYGYIPYQLVSDSLALYEYVNAGSESIGVRKYISKINYNKLSADSGIKNIYDSNLSEESFSRDATYPNYYISNYIPYVNFSNNVVNFSTIENIDSINLSITYNETDSETYSKWIITIKKLEPIGVSSLHLIFNNSNGYFVKKMKSGLVRICRKDNIISGTIYPSTKNNDDLIFSRIKFYVKIQQN